MIEEQNFEFKHKLSEILDILLNKDTIEDEDGEINIVIKYLGEKDQKFFEKISSGELTQFNSSEHNLNNNLLLLKYKDIYIGSISIYNMKIREGFGFNIYSEDSFYYGQWHNNMKEGKGLLKIDNNSFYVGNFTQNQFNGFGILYFKKLNIFYIGEFDNGQMKEGVYFDLNQKIFYRGKFKDNKKDSKICSFYEMRNNHLFLGEVSEDEFTKGYLCISQVNQEEKNTDEGIGTFFSFGMTNFFYFDKSNEKDIRFVHKYAFTQNFGNLIQKIFMEILQSDHCLFNEISKFIEFFSIFDEIGKNNIYKNKNNLERYDTHQNQEPFEKNFLSNYEQIISLYDELNGELDLEKHIKELEQPDIDKELDF